jgi:RNA polymerase sigma-70 factor, ECF subfamily
MQLTDEQIVQQTLNGEVEAFGVLVRRWEGKVYGLSYRMLGQYEDARDACQEIFIAVYRNLGKFRGEAKFSSWLYRIAMNCCHDRLRARSMHTVALDESMAIPVDGSAQGDLERQQKIDHVRTALNALPYELRQVVIMKEYEGLTFKEISEILNIPVSTAKTRLYTGLDQLKKRLLTVREAL